jgi:hypothetical protein
MEAIFPLVPLAGRQALCVGIMSYNGQVNFGLVGDYDAMGDLESFGLDLEHALEEAFKAAGKRSSRRRPRRAEKVDARGNGRPAEAGSQSAR